MEQTQRFDAFDAVRAWALLAGIVLHAAMSFMPAFEEVRWPIADVSNSPAMDLLFFVIHVFRMSLFFIIAGFFARLLHQRLGTAGMLKNRLRRIALPLLAAMVLVMPLAIAAVIWAARQSGGVQGPPLVQPPAFVGPAVPWGHLWFLYLLLVLYFSVALLRAVVVKLDGRGALRTAIGRALAGAIAYRVAPVLLAAPLVAILVMTPWWQTWQGIPAPIVGLVPNLPALVAFGGAFLVGWFLHREQDALRRLAADWPLHLAIALAATVAALYLEGFSLRFVSPPMGDSARASFAAAYALASWSWCFAAIGMALRFIDRPHARWRYLADASYWMYLVHLPIVWLLQAWMMKWPLHWSVKFTLILAITTTVLLASYQYLVRGSFIGQFLNGRKIPRGGAAALTSKPSTSPG